jgi:hypothetical protein
MIFSTIGSIIALVATGTTTDEANNSDDSLSTTVDTTSAVDLRSLGLFLAMVGNVLQAIFMLLVKHLAGALDSNTMLFYSSVPTVSRVMSRC